MEPDQVLDGSYLCSSMEEAEEPLSPPQPPRLINRQRRAKRPRFSSDSAVLPQSFLPINPTPNKRSKQPPPSSYFTDRPSTSPRCVFCQIPGNVRECEGTLLGPFLPARNHPSAKPIYAHRNCALWAPEVYHEAKTDRLMGVHNALARARRLKCTICNAPNPSLSCMFQSTACCRPMHFRCALLAGASLIEGFKTFCPKHSKRSDSPSGRGPPPSIELHYERTPVAPRLLDPGSGCTECDGDSYNPELGSILTCSQCSSRQHSKCIVPNAALDGALSSMSWQDMYFCKNCMRCPTCARPIDQKVYSHPRQPKSVVGQSDFADGLHRGVRELQCDSVLCVGCKHFACHVACLPEASSPELWRCDLCLICKHCNAMNIPRREWNESLEACGACTDEVRKGGVVCPICVKVYREGENIPMIQCDYCDKWIHAKQCGGLSDKQFKSLTESDAKYRCPLCEKDKNRRDSDRRRSAKGGAASRNGLMRNGSVSARTTVDLAPLLNQLPINDPAVTFFSVQKPAGGSSFLATVFAQLAPDIEVCLRCCSSGNQQKMRYCMDCGETYHDFCHGSGGFSPFARLRISKKGNQNGRVRDGRLWRCEECESVKRSRGDQAKDHVTSNGVADRDSAGMRESAKRSRVDQTQNMVMSNAVADGNSAGTRRANGHSLDLILCRDVSSERICNGTPFSSEDTLPQTERPLKWRDLRECELCGEQEYFSGEQGRLIPWGSSTDSNESHCWVHVGCMIWSVGVSMHMTAKMHDVLLAPRRKLLHFARHTSCKLCRCRGATLKCSASGCNSHFHFDCAKSGGVNCVITFSNELMAKALLNKERSKSHSVLLSEVRSLRILCSEHSAIEEKSNDLMITLAEAEHILDLSRAVKAFDTTDFSKDFEPPQKKLLKPGHIQSIRVGSLSVLHFGRLVPEVDDFIVKGCLVPLGYCATRRFWSMVDPWKRCLYFLEICGFVETGPEFVIRCSDCPSERISAKDPDEAWANVTRRILDLRRGANIDISHWPIRTSGLQAFGLSHCIPVMTAIESLPMASMFNGRYALKRVATHRSNEVVFYNTLAKKYKPPEIRKNISGCARSEGYVPDRWISRNKKNDGDLVPNYQHARTGAAFQLEVAREVFCRNTFVAQKRIPERRTFQQQEKLQSKTVEAQDRSRANRSAPQLPFATQHRSIAKSSKERTVILRSEIDGYGVFATQNIAAGEMIIEYVGEIIRPVLSDIREARYLENQVGCYMFQIEPGLIVDATVCGNAARYINHSCAPNCLSRTVALENGRKVVVIFAKRNIQRGEELSYDYLFPLDDSDRVRCGCAADNCKGWMN